MKFLKNPVLFAMAFTIVAAFAFSSCKKDNDSGTTSRNIKYEITGNFTGKLLIVYNDNVSGNTTLTNVSIPWTKEITYSSNVLAIGIGGNASTPGTPGQTVTLKLYAGGNLIKSETKTAGSLGELSLAGFAYSF